MEWLQSVLTLFINLFATVYSYWLLSWCSRCIWCYTYSDTISRLQDLNVSSDLYIIKNILYLPYFMYAIYISFLHPGLSVFDIVIGDSFKKVVSALLLNLYMMDTIKVLTFQYYLCMFYIDDIVIFVINKSFDNTICHINTNCFIYITNFHL